MFKWINTLRAAKRKQAAVRARKNYELTVFNTRMFLVDAVCLGHEFCDGCKLKRAGGCKLTDVLDALEESALKRRNA